MPSKDDATQMRAVLAQRQNGSKINDKRYDAHQMKLGGASWDVIASNLGYNNGQAAYRAVTMYLEEASVKFANHRQEEALELQLQRCEALISKYWESAMSGDIDSANYVLKIMQEENKLLRLYEEQGGTSVTKYVVINSTREGYVDDLKEIATKSQQLAISGSKGTNDHE